MIRDNRNVSFGIVDFTIYKTVLLSEMNVTKKKLHACIRFRGM